MNNKITTTQVILTYHKGAGEGKIDNVLERTTRRLYRVYLATSPGENIGRDEPPPFTVAAVTSALPSRGLGSPGQCSMAHLCLSPNSVVTSPFGSPSPTTISKRHISPMLTVFSLRFIPLSKKEFLLLDYIYEILIRF